MIVFFRASTLEDTGLFVLACWPKKLYIYDAVNVGAAGTLVVRKPGLLAKFVAELPWKLPFEATSLSAKLAI